MIRARNKKGPTWLSTSGNSGSSRLGGRRGTSGGFCAKTMRVLSEVMPQRQSKSKKSGDDREGILGMKDPRDLYGHFSFGKASHVIRAFLILCVFVFSSVFLNWCLDSRYRSELERQQSSEIEDMNALFHSEVEFLKSEHEDTIKGMQEMHDATMESELQWFIDETRHLESTQGVLQSSHNEHFERQKSTQTEHEQLKTHSSRIDSELNALYDEAGNEIDTLSTQLQECQRKKEEMKNKIDSAKLAQNEKQKNEKSESENKYNYENSYGSYGRHGREEEIKYTDKHTSTNTVGTAGTAAGHEAYYNYGYETADRRVPRDYHYQSYYNVN